MPAVISRVLPNAKFIIVMRNPVTRLYSHFLYSYQLRYGAVENWPLRIKENGSHLFHNVVLKHINVFHECMKKMSAFECAYFIQAYGGSLRLAIGLYVVHIKKWLQFFPRENFLFVKMENMSKYPVKTMSLITQFLGVSPVSKGTASRMLRATENVLQSKQGLTPMDEKTEAILQEFYQPYNVELAELLEDDCFLWSS